MTDKKPESAPENASEKASPRAKPAAASKTGTSSSRTAKPAASKSGAATPSAAKPDAAEGVEKPARGGVSGPLALMGLLLLGILTGGAAWHFQQQLMALEAAQDDFATSQALSALAEAQDNRIGEIGGRVEALNTALESRLSEMARLENRVADQGESAGVLAERVDQLYRRMQSETEDWRVAEAAYLGRIAIHRLRFNADVPGALEALEAADILLAGLGGSGVDRREAIARATDRLLDVQTPDVTAISRGLSQVADALPDLPLTDGLQAAASSSASKPATAEAGTGWEARLDRARSRLLEGLSGLVTISRDRQVEPLPDPESRFLLSQNLLLQVETARLAAVRGEAENYLAAIERIDAWVSAYFDSASPAVAAVREQLDALAQQPVEITTPAIGADLAPLFDEGRAP